MWKKIAVAVVALVIVALAGGFFFLRSLASDDSVRATLQARLGDVLGQPVRIGRAHLVFSPKIGIELTDVAIGEPPRVALGSVRLVTGLGPLLSRRVEHAEAIVERGEIDLPLPAFRIGGPAPAVPAGAAAAGGAGIAIVSVDTIALRGIAVKSRDRTLTIDLETTLAQNRLDVRRLAARADQTLIEGTGAITDLSTFQASLALKANELDLDRLIAFLSSFAPESTPPAATTAAATPGPAAPAPARLVVTLAAPKGQMAGVPFTDLTAQATVTRTAITIDPLSFRIFGGTYGGTLALDLSAATPTFTWDAALDHVNAAEALKHAGAGNVMSGTVSGRVHLTGSGTDAATALKLVKGSGKIDVRDGTLPTLKLVSATVNALGKPGAEPAGSADAFTLLGGTFTLADGIMASNDLVLNSRDLDVDGAGTVSLAAGTLDVKGKLRLSEEMSKRVGGEVKRLMTENNRVVLPAVVTGPVSQPTVLIDLKAATTRALNNAVQSQINKGLSGLLNKNKKKKGGG